MRGILHYAIDRRLEQVMRSCNPEEFEQAREKIIKELTDHLVIKQLMDHVAAKTYDLSCWQVECVMGLSPKCEDGKEYECELGLWNQLVLYIDHIAPEVALACNHWENFGEKTNAATAEKLASLLKEQIDKGETGRYARSDDFECMACFGTGSDEHGKEGFGCWECDGSGKAKNYFSVSEVRQFQRFLESCGGFIPR